MQEEYTPDLISLSDDDGKEYNFEVLDSYDEQEVQYVAMTPYYTETDDENVVNLEDDVGMPLAKKQNLSELAKALRDSDVLKNHLVTNTTDTAMQRFKALKQGQNFHSLDDALKTNTYTDATRTQNTIYLRLNYDEPSGTVVNVRK